MNGYLKKIKQGTDYIFPVTHSDGVLVGANKNLTELLEAGFSTYIINLDKWGITQGIPSKPYTRIDFLKADANIKGINDALSYASDNGFTHIVLPRGEYALCYPNEIMMKSNLTFNLNGSRLKVIYDSTVKSPLDGRSGTDYYNFYGRSFIFSKVYNSHLLNGRIEGCKYDRSFTDTNEKLVEHSYGVVFTDGSTNCSITHCLISGYMGDNVSFVSMGITKIGLPLKFLGDLDSNGQDIASSNALVTDFITIPSTERNAFTIGGSGYSYTTALNIREVDVAFYKTDGSFIGKLIKKRIWSSISIPLSATKMRIKFYNETDTTKDLALSIHFGNIPMYNNVQYNEIFFGHRGGITGGGSYNEIKNNIIRDNGLYNNTFLDGKPNFPDTTRYAINQEDSFGDNTVIKNNVFYGGFHGVLVRCYSCHIQDNLFYNFDSTCIIVYSMEFARISGNYFYRANRAVDLFGSATLAGRIIIDNNSFTSAELNVGNADYTVNIHDNHFTDCLGTLGNAVFKNNYIKASTNLIISSAELMDGNTFYGDGIDSTKYIKLDVNKIINCTFRNVYSIIAKTTGDRSSLLKNCNIINSDIEVNVTGGSRKVDFLRCDFLDSRPRASNISLIGTSTINLIECNFEIVNGASIFHSVTNVVSGAKYIVDKAKIRISNTISSIISFQYVSTNTTSFTLKNSEIEFMGTLPLSSDYYANNGNSIYESVLANNKLSNITFSTLSGTKYINYDPSVSGTSEPISGYFSLGKLFSNSTPTSGAYVGWICITEGYANKTAWTVSTSYTVGQQINTGGKVYQCIVAGTSGSTAPSHTTGTAVDGSVTWQYISPLAVFKQYGVISN